MAAFSSSKWQPSCLPITHRILNKNKIQPQTSDTGVSLRFQTKINSLNKFMFTQVGKHVAVIAKDITSEKLDAVFLAYLVHLQEDFLRAACQADLEDKRHQGRLCLCASDQNKQTLSLAQARVTLFSSLEQKIISKGLFRWFLSLRESHNLLTKPLLSSSTPQGGIGGQRERTSWAKWHRSAGTHHIKPSKEFLRFLFNILGVRFHLNHGIEVLNALQGRLRSVLSRGAGWKQELASRVFQGHLGGGGGAGGSEQRAPGTFLLPPLPSEGRSLSAC